MKNKMLSFRKAIAVNLVLFLLIFTSGFSANASTADKQYIQNDSFWHDTSGNPIYAQTGNIIKADGTYYWYGIHYSNADIYYNNPAGKNKTSNFVAVNCYSSTDLINWTNEGQIVTAADLGTTSVVGLSGMAYNANTKQYVLVGSLTGDLAPDGGVFFATNSTPTGHFTLRNVQTSITNVINNSPGDNTIFSDDNGQTYLVFCNTHGRTHLYVAPLNPNDYLSVEPATNIYNSRNGGREGCIMFKHSGTYYFCTSDLHGYNASHTYYISATNALGPYSAESVMQGTDADFSHVTQTSMAYEVGGLNGSTVIFGGSRWCDFAGNGFGYNQWCPITFNGTTPVFHSLNQWTIDASTGAWSAGPDNNYAMNPSFDADRVSQTALAGWTETYTGGGGADPNGNNNRASHTGMWHATQTSASAYTATRYQNLTVPNGTYTLSAWVKSSGGQNTAQIYAKNYGGSQRNVSVNSSIDDWKLVSIPNIQVANGTIEIGFYSNANAGNWLYVDDFSLTRSVSKDFDSLAVGDDWDTTVGSTGGAAYLAGAVATTSGVSGQVFQVSGGGTGARSLYKTFSPVFQGSKLQMDFDWNIGSPAHGTGQLRIQDSAHNNYLTFSVPTGRTGTLLYSTSPEISGEITTSNGGVAVSGSGFNTANQTYHVNVTLDLNRQRINFTLTNAATPAQTVTVSNIPFASGASYQNNVGALEFYATRNSHSTMSWTTWLDNFNVYAISP